MLEKSNLLLLLGLLLLRAQQPRGSYLISADSFGTHWDSAGWWSLTHVQQPPVHAFQWNHSTKRGSVHPIWNSCSARSSGQIQRTQNIRKGTVVVNLSSEQDYQQWAESWRPSRLRFCNLEQWDRITEFDRSRYCRRKGLKCSTNG